MKLARHVTELHRLLKRRDEIEFQILELLPAYLGFDSPHELVTALRKHNSRDVRQRATLALRGGPRGHDARYSDRTKASIRRAFKQGKPASTIRTRYGTSLATLAKWKRQWGLTNPRNAKNRKAPLRTAPKGSRLNGHATPARS